MGGNQPIRPGLGMGGMGGYGGGYGGMYPGFSSGGQPGGYLPGNFFTGGKALNPNIPILPGLPIDPNAGAAQTQPGFNNNPLNPVSPNNPFANPGQPFVPMLPFNPMGPGMIPPPESESYNTTHPFLRENNQNINSEPFQKKKSQSGKHPFLLLFMLFSILIFNIIFKDPLTHLSNLET